MTVELNVVGIFYTKAVEIGASGSKTVKDVMDLAVQQSTEPLFRYMTMENGSIVSSLMACHTKDFESRSHKKYPKGVYNLGQTFTSMPPNPYSVWQYYLFNDKNERVPVAAETSYVTSPVQDKWKIVWRLVTVCNAPTGLPHRLDKLLPHGSPSPATV